MSGYLPPPPQGANVVNATAVISKVGVGVAITMATHEEDNNVELTIKRDHIGLRGTVLGGKPFLTGIYGVEVGFVDGAQGNTGCAQGPVGDGSHHVPAERGGAGGRVSPWQRNTAETRVPTSQDVTVVQDSVGLKVT